MILTEDERAALALAQAALVAARGKGNASAEKAAAEAARNELVMEIGRRYGGQHGLKTELARALGIHRTTVERIYVKRKTGRAAYRRAPRRGRATP